MCLSGKFRSQVNRLCRRMLTRLLACNLATICMSGRPVSNSSQLVEWQVRAIESRG